MEIDKLVSLDGDGFDNQFGWVDWRQDDAAIIDIFKSQVTDKFPIDSEQKDGGLMVRYYGQPYSIPLTHTVCDRYITINSLAEIISDTHSVWLHKNAMENDTHGILVLPNNHSEELKRNHAPWIESHLQALRKGVDEFSGLTIPYVGHEDNAPCLAGELRVLEANREARDIRIQQASQQSERATRQFRYKSYLSLVIPGLITLAIIWMLILKYQEPDCRVRVDGKCLVDSVD